jgi:thioesterase domain-containing protein
MAHVYIPLLLTAQPRGQFRLGGYCNGGLLAWEIAHRLHHAGREVESVTLINTFSLNARPLLRGFNRLLCGLTPFVQPSTSRSRVGRSLMSALWKLGGRGRIGLRGPPKWSRPASAASISRRSVTRAMRHTCARWRITSLPSSIATSSRSSAKTMRTFSIGRLRRGRGSPAMFGARTNRTT